MKKEKSTASKLKTVDAILSLLFIFSMCLDVWAIIIYRGTIIETKYLIAVVAFGTLIAFPIILFSIKAVYSTFLSFILSFLIGGGLSYFGLLFVNQVFADNEYLTEDFEILKTGNLARGKGGSCSQPYAVIDFNGLEKELIFYCEFEKTIQNYSKISLTFSRGLFGFAVIKSKLLTQ